MTRLKLLKEAGMLSNGTAYAAVFDRFTPHAHPKYIIQKLQFSEQRDAKEAFTRLRTSAEIEDTIKGLNLLVESKMDNNRDIREQFFRSPTLNYAQILIREQVEKDKFSASAKSLCTTHTLVGSFSKNLSPLLARVDPCLTTTSCSTSLYRS